MAVRPDLSPAQRAGTPQPAALTAPRPVTTTRRRSAASLSIRGAGFGQPALDEGGQVGERSENAPVHLVARDADAVRLLERDHQLQRVHRIQAETRAEERLVVGDALRREAVEVQRGHDQLLEVGADRFLLRHRARTPTGPLPPCAPPPASRTWPTTARGASAGRWAARAAAPPARRRAPGAAACPATA